MRIEQLGGVAILRMEEGKGNAIGPAFLDALEGALDGLPPGPLVVTGQGSCFSAGLQLPVLLPLERVAMGAFIRRYERLMLRIFSLPQPVVAAINGHAIAGGCVLALQCDARIAAAGKARIGLNEAALGIGLPAVVLETLRFQVPGRALVPVALEGRLFDPAEAQALGLIDEVVAPEELEARALVRARELGQIAPAAYARVKTSIRRDVQEAIARRFDGESERWLALWFSPAARATLAATAARLGGS